MTQGKHIGLMKLLLAALLSIALVSPLAMPSLAIADQLAQQQEQVDGAQTPEQEGDTQADDAAVGASDAAGVPDADADSTDDSASADASDIAVAADPAEATEPASDSDSDPDPASTEAEAQQPHVLYKSHVQTYGWESDWSLDNQTSGSTGQSKRIEGVYIKLDTAGYRYIGGNANDQWRQFCDSDDLSDLKPGMVVGVEKSPSVLGRRYGHVGIYVGNGVVRHNSATALENTKLGEWLDTYNYSYNAAWGFMS